MINWSHVNELKQDMDDAFDEIVEVFLEEVQEGIDALDDTMSADDMAAGLHFLKGAALNFGLERFATLCGEGEDLARQGQAQKVDLGVIRESYVASKREFLVGLRKDAA